MGRSRRGMGRYIDKRIPSTFKIQITSMVDMFVILLVFLLRSYSTSPVQITPSDDLTLPSSSSITAPEETLKMVVSKNGIFVDDKKIIEMKDGVIATSDVDENDTQFIRALYTELDEQAKKTRMIASKNTELEFDGKVLMQAERSLPYELLRKVMYTSMLAGYSDVKLAVILKD
ncbi:MAG: biopolymer transporter ExbD [Bdellovibrionales bacterium]|jgi:biopolymer transport protein ExbD|nr:biopolymer transporter ExbD [Bdellovibrionales bacterium]